MSYILDALKKSEQERGHGNIPDVQTVHSSSLNYRSDKKASWPYILSVAVLLNLAAIAYFIFDKNNPVESVQPTQKNISQVPAADDKDDTVSKRPSAIPVPLASESTVEHADSSIPAKTDSAAEQSPEEPIQQASAKPEPVAKEIPPPSQIATPPKPLQVSSGNTDDILDFHELPEQIKQQLPSITISAHVYSSNPLQRSIVINNNFMEEGEYVLDGLTLHEITRDGAVFNYQGTLFNYGVVSGWQ